MSLITREIIRAYRQTEANSFRLVPIYSRILRNTLNQGQVLKGASSSLVRLSLIKAGMMRPTGLVALSTKLIKPTIRSKIINRHRNMLTLFFQHYMKKGNYVLSLDNAFLLLSSKVLLQHLLFVAYRAGCLTAKPPFKADFSKLANHKLQDGSQQTARQMALFMSQQPSFPLIREQCRLFLKLLQKYRLLLLLQQTYNREEGKKVMIAFRRMVRQVAWRTQAHKYIMLWVKSASVSRCPELLKAVLQIKN